VIFTHSQFDTPGVDPIDGTWSDIQAVEKAFYPLGFNVLKPPQNLDKAHLIAQAKSIAAAIDPRSSFFVCVIKTHGAEGDFLWARDSLYHVNELINIFVRENCPALAGKPKLFIIEACRGPNYGIGIKPPNYPQVNASSSDPDIVICWSTMQGFVSWNTGEGGVFIQDWCEKFTLALAKPNQPTVFHHILTEVMNSVAQKRFYFDMAEGVKHIVKQTPTWFFHSVS